MAATGGYDPGPGGGAPVPPGGAAPGGQGYGGPPPGYGYGAGGGMGMRRMGMGSLGMRRMFPIETKPFLVTSEFWVGVALTVALAIGTSVDEDATLVWILLTVLASAYIISRGIAKSGTRSHAPDPREHMQFGGGGSEQGRQ